MADERHVGIDAEGLEQGIEMRAVLDEAVAVGAAGLELGGVPHADQVGRDAAAVTLEMGDHVAPQI